MPAPKALTGKIEDFLAPAQPFELAGNGCLLPAGTYDFYLYGHGPSQQASGKYTLDLAGFPGTPLYRQHRHHLGHG